MQVKSIIKVNSQQFIQVEDDLCGKMKEKTILGKLNEKEIKVFFYNDHILFGCRSCFTCIIKTKP